jgi:hypothetical protein
MIEAGDPLLPCLATILITLLLAVPAMSVESGQFRWS